LAGEKREKGKTFANLNANYQTKLMSRVGATGEQGAEQECVQKY